MNTTGEGSLENTSKEDNSALTLNSVLRRNSYSMTQNSQEKPANALETFIPSLTSLSEIWEEELRTDILQREQSPKHPIGLKELDNVLWGLHKKELTVIGAMTSQGKSAFSMFLAKKMVEQMQRVAYFSLEMSKSQLVERLLTNILRIDNRMLRRGMAKDDMLKDEEVFKTWLNKAKLLVDDKYGYNFEHVVRVIDIIKPDFVFIDYIQMISLKGFKNKTDAIEEYVRRLKEMANTQNFGLIVISQLNRSGTEGVDIHKFKWAAVLEEHADNCLLLQWDWAIDHPNDFIINVAKQRHGEVKNGLKIKFVPQFSDFEDIDKYKEDLYAEKEPKPDWRNK